MTQISKYPLKKEVEQELLCLFTEIIAGLRRPLEINEFLDDFLSPIEKIMLAKRLAIAILVGKGCGYDHIRKVLKVTPGTIASVSLKYKYGSQGYKKVVDRIISEEKVDDVFRKINDLLNIVPPKGSNWSIWRREKELAKRPTTSLR